MKETHTIELPAIKDVQFTVIAEPETTFQEILLRRHPSLKDNVWAWAQVEVRASYRGLEASDYLGCCSYESEEEFKKGGYYDDMKAATYAGLIAQLKALYGRPTSSASPITIRKSKPLTQ